MSLAKIRQLGAARLSPRSRKNRGSEEPEFGLAKNATNFVFSERINSLFPRADQVKAPYFSIYRAFIKFKIF